MSAEHAKAGAVVNLFPAQPDELKSSTLIRAAHVEVFRLVLEKGKHLAEHRAAGAITIQCLQGEVELTAGGQTARMGPASLVYLDDGAPHAVTALTESVLLVSMWLRRA